jgi:para-nitrobenzyl esterase
MNKQAFSISRIEFRSGSKISVEATGILPSDQVPGEYQGCVPLNEIGRAWALWRRGPGLQGEPMRPRNLAAVSLGLAAALALVAPGLAHAQPTAPQVTVESGALAGVREADVVSFKGVPFAASPVGDLRWRPPQAAKPWKGVRAADKYGPICQQTYNAGDNGVGPLPMSEDCLTLNVFAPADAKALPVMVWIHGGGFVNGSGTAALYDGSALARQGVVVVTINYRLGRFGFFAHPALTAEAKGEPVGNYGLMDMIAVLKWVRANIARFGGDPRQVTIFGESAGGIAVNDLMASPAARGLFVRAIVESGLGRETTLALPAAEKLGEAFAAKAGLANATAADLRRLTPEQILAAGDPDIRIGGGSMADGKILPMPVVEAFAKGLEAQVPYLAGWNSLEFPVPAAQAEKFIGDLAADDPRISGIKASYPDPESFQTYFVSDLLFTEPALALAGMHAAHGQPTWVYRFSVLSPSVRGRFKGTPHAQERQYVFQTLNTSPWPTDANDAAQAKTMSAYWTSFAKIGDPNGEGRPAWPRYDRASDQILDFGNDGPSVIAPPRRKALDAIADLHRETGR